MKFWMQWRRGMALALTVLTMGGALAAPITARADDGDKGKQGKKDGKKDLPIVIGPATIVKDPPPKKEKK